MPTLSKLSNFKNALNSTIKATQAEVDNYERQIKELETKKKELERLTDGEVTFKNFETELKALTTERNKWLTAYNKRLMKLQGKEEKAITQSPTGTARKKGATDFLQKYPAFDAYYTFIETSDGGFVAAANRAQNDPKAFIDGLQ